MTNVEREKVLLLAGEGLGYVSIAKELNIKANTVKTFLRRNKEIKHHCSNVTVSDNRDSKCYCKHCGKGLTLIKGKKKKTFCDSRCRYLYFLSKNKTKKKICTNCHNEFYGNYKQKFCSHECYLQARYGRNDD